MIKAKYYLRLIKGNEVLYESPDLGDEFEAKSLSKKDLALGLAQSITKTKAAEFVNIKLIND